LLDHYSLTHLKNKQKPKAEDSITLEKYIDLLAI